MNINSEKCLSTGSNPGLGYKVDKDRHFYIDESEVLIVKEIFERYTRNESKKEIIEDLTRRGIKTSRGNDFVLNSLSHILSNKGYIRYYLYKGKEVKDGMTRTLDDNLFYKVQERMEKNRHAKAHSRAKEEYLFTTKLFFGHYKEMVIGYGGTRKRLK